MNAVREGGLETKLSMFLMGFGNMVHGQKVKGLLYLAVEVIYLVFMAVNGVGFLRMLGSLGSEPQKEIWDEASQVYLYTKGDQSVLILLYGVATVLLTIFMVCMWRGALRSAYKAECLDKARKACEQLRGGPEIFVPRKSVPSVHDSADGVYLYVHDFAADLYDLYGIYQLQQTGQPSDAV